MNRNETWRGVRRGLGNRGSPGLYKRRRNWWSCGVSKSVSLTCLPIYTTTEWKRKKGGQKLLKPSKSPLKRNPEKTRSLSLRTQYSRLLKPLPSGSGDKPLSSKQQWLKRNLDFLKPFFVPRHSGSSLVLEENEQHADTQDQESMDDSDEVLRLSLSNTGSPFQHLKVQLSSLDQDQVHQAHPDLQAHPLPSMHLSPVSVGSLSKKLRKTPNLLRLT
ncbi:uncharacterized protein LOC118815073 [Colossoma macropomum]|uniref:uncharacterized protein LOC118815073 n=1 Tax=Colossoma macropomum TaxID=42526 RepID=UPI00186427E4|nr:uncharacterized protein LOC118815073 [Colossoma macropomum]